MHGGPDSGVKAARSGESRAACGGNGKPAAETKTPAAAAAPPHLAISVASGAAGAFESVSGTWVFLFRHMPGVVTRPFTSEPAAASLAVSPAGVPRPSSDDSVASLASAVALA